MRRGRHANYGTFSSPLPHQSITKLPQGIEPTAELITEIEALQFKKRRVDSLATELGNYTQQIAILNTKIEAIDTHLRDLIALLGPHTDSLANTPDSLIVLSLEKVTLLKKREGLLDGLRYHQLTAELQKAKTAYAAQEKKCDALYQKIQSASDASNYAPTL